MGELTSRGKLLAIYEIIGGVIGLALIGISALQQLSHTMMGLWLLILPR